MAVMRGIRTPAWPAPSASGTASSSVIPAFSLSTRTATAPKVRQRPRPLPARRSTPARRAGFPAAAARTVPAARPGARRRRAVPARTSPRVGASCTSSGTNPWRRHSASVSSCSPGSRGEEHSCRPPGRRDAPTTAPRAGRPRPAPRRGAGRASGRSSGRGRSPGGVRRRRRGCPAGERVTWSAVQISAGAGRTSGMVCGTRRSARRSRRRPGRAGPPPCSTALSPVPGQLVQPVHPGHDLAGLASSSRPASVSRT